MSGSRDVMRTALQLPRWEKMMPRTGASNMENSGKVGQYKETLSTDHVVFLLRTMKAQVFNTTPGSHL